ncbi:MAG: hypothetical protein METHP_01671 [Methanoregula sp. SKADARSKE-2]|nr:MAG: hypothetical protein METHP_01671 [Methanoregula sp. SKADARSKE-2]
MHLCFRDGPVLALIEEYRVALLAAWIALMIRVMGSAGSLLDHDGGFTRGDHFLHTLTGWMGVLALMGMGRRHYLNRSTPLTAYLTASSYPVYIIHQAAVSRRWRGVIIIVEMIWLCRLTFLANYVAIVDEL